MRLGPTLLGPLGDRVVEGRATKLEKVLGLSGIACFAVLVLLDLYWDSTMPEHPDALHARVWELNNHGHVVYVTATRHFALEGLFYGSLAFAALAAWRFSVRRRNRWRELGRQL